MAEIKATANPIIVDKEAGEITGSTTIEYTKEPSQEIWYRIGAGNWSLINVDVVTGKGDEAKTNGVFPVTLQPGQTYEACVFEAGHGPLADPIRVACVKVFCVWKKPEVRDLITDFTGVETGGTWHVRRVITKVPTNVLTIGVSRTPPTIDNNGMPHLKAPEGASTAPLTFTNSTGLNLNRSYRATAISLSSS